MPNDTFSDFRHGIELEGARIQNQGLLAQADEVECHYGYILDYRPGVQTVEEGQERYASVGIEMFMGQLLCHHLT